MMRSGGSLRMCALILALTLTACPEDGDDDGDTVQGDTQVATDSQVTDTLIDTTTAPDTTPTDTVPEADTVPTDTVVADTTPVDTTPATYRILAGVSDIRGRVGQVLVILGPNNATSVCAPIDSDPFSLAPTALTEITGDNPCADSTAEAAFTADTYAVTAGVYTPGETTPDASVAAQVAIVNADANVTFDGGALSRVFTASDDCTDVAVLGDGSYDANTTGANNDDETYVRACGDGGGDPGTPTTLTGPDAAYAVTAAPGELLVVRKVSATAGLLSTGRMALVDDCSDAGGTCYRMGPEHVAWLNDGNETASKTLVVDAEGTDAGALNFTVETVTADSIPAREAWTTAELVTGAGPHALSGDTSTALNVHDGYTSSAANCGANQQANGPEHVYLIRVPAQSRLLLTPLTSYADIRYLVTESFEDMEGGCRFFSQFIFPVSNRTDAAVDFYVVIDGRYPDSAGSYSLTATITPLL